MTSVHTWLIVGLGNPGPNYYATRHNIGYRVVDAIAESNHLSFTKNSKAAALTCEARLGVSGPKIILAKSLNYMNLIGSSIAALAKFYKIAPENIIAVHDELDIPFGHLRIKIGGGSGGHNGLKDMTRALGTENYLRLRMGISRPSHGNVSQYVLQKFSKSEEQELPFEIDRAQQAIAELLEKPLDQVQNTHHARNPK
ncbi:MAG: aminoacyl-tRNA hydrolase [Micrococcaceae bacterium]